MQRVDGRDRVQRTERPWGTQLQYAHNEPCTVTLMIVEPGQRLSLQSHRDRTELWIILDDGAEVQVGERVVHPKAGDEIRIARAEMHRLSSTGPTVRVLEVAFGPWDQADITRYEDDYDRPRQGE